MLRDPVARAISAFYHHVRVGGRIDPARSFAENAATWGIVHMGFYAAHLERWLDVFRKDRFLVMIFEEVMQDPQTHLTSVTTHVGLPPLELPPERLQQRVHGGTKYRGDDGQYYYDEDRTQLAISHDDLDMLREVYRPENEHLGALLGRDLDPWPS